MSKRTIEDVINERLSGDARKNALEFVACIRAKNLPIDLHDENNESGWGIPDLAFIVITGSDEFPSPWGMWMGAADIGEGLDVPADEQLKEFAWANAATCGSCGGDCSPGINTRIFGKDFKNTCQTNLMFVNPDSGTVENINKLVDIIVN